MKLKKNKLMNYNAYMFGLFGKNWSETPITRKKLLKRVSMEEKKIVVENNSFTESLQFNSFVELFNYIHNMTHPLKQEGLNTVIYSGPLDSPLCFVGEAPGAEENQLKKPFVGASGQLLDRLLQQVGLNRQKIFVTNTVYWRPPFNRQPTVEETKLCYPFLKQIISLVKPKVLVCLGAVATKAIMNLDHIMKNRGLIKEGTLAPYEMATFHPSFILRMPKQENLLKEDLVNLVNLLKKLNIYSEVKL